MVMREPVRERIEKLREEIAQINAANRVYLQSGKKPPGAADHERRRERLQQIVDELAALTDWKKP
jgi:CHASE3 domain sensor protein